MALVINTNLAALNAQRHLEESGASLNKSLERLSSGLRIHNAYDAAAGVAIADRLGADVRIASQAIRNANDGLSVLAIEGGMKFLRLARERLAAGDAVRFTEHLSRVQAIIAELRGTLDHAAGGAIAGDLARLYEFMLFHLTEANARQSVRHVDEVIRVFGTIADAFRTVLARGAEAP